MNTHQDLKSLFSLAVLRNYRQGTEDIPILPSIQIYPAATWVSDSMPPPPLPSSLPLVPLPPFSNISPEPKRRGDLSFLINFS